MSRRDLRRGPTRIRCGIGRQSRGGPRWRQALLLALLSASLQTCGTGVEFPDIDFGSGDSACETRPTTPPAEPEFVRIDPGSFTMGTVDPELMGFFQGGRGVTLTRPFEIAIHEVTIIERWWDEVSSWYQQFSCASAVVGLVCAEQSVSFYEALLFANSRSVAEGLEPCYDLSSCGIVTVLAPGLPDQPEYQCTEAPPAPDPACLGYRLPTEAEWEYAARELGTVELGCEDHPPSFIPYQNRNQCALPYCMPQGGVFAGLPWWEYRKNALGLYAMDSGVWEWTWDTWDPDYASRSPTVDPMNTEPDPWGRRVIRGGSIASLDGRYNYLVRGGLMPGQHHPLVGFRLVRTLPE